MTVLQRESWLAGVSPGTSSVMTCSCGGAAAGSGSLSTGSMMTPVILGGSRAAGPGATWPLTLLACMAACQVPVMATDTLHAWLQVICVYKQ